MLQLLWGPNRFAAADANLCCIPRIRRAQSSQPKICSYSHIADSSWSCVRFCSQSIFRAADWIGSAGRKTSCETVRRESRSGKPVQSLAGGKSRSTTRIWTCVHPRALNKFRVRSGVRALALRQRKPNGTERRTVNGSRGLPPEFFLHHKTDVGRSDSKFSCELSERCPFCGSPANLSRLV